MSGLMNDEHDLPVDAPPSELPINAMLHMWAFKHAHFEKSVVIEDKVFISANQGLHWPWIIMLRHILTNINMHKDAPSGASDATHVDIQARRAL